MNGFAGREIRKTPSHSDLVTLVDTRITLDRLHQRARFALFGGGALAVTSPGQSRPERVNRERRSGEVVPRKKIGVHRQIGFNPLQARNDTGERTHMFSKARDSRPRGHGAIATTRHDQLGTWAELDRRGRSPRIAQFLAATGHALRAFWNVVLDDSRAEQIVTDDVVV